MLHVQVFNLTNSLLGGGTLSLPFVFAKCGVLVSVCLVGFSMSLSIFSLTIICELSEKLGCSSYSEVMEKALGEKARSAATYCLVVMLFFVVIAYLILLRDVASELFEYFTPDSIQTTVLMKNTILTTLTALAYPLMTARSLHALRYASYCGTSCILFLLFCLVYRTIHNSDASPESASESEKSGAMAGMLPGDIHDVLTALPITFIGFLCHFNVNGVFSDLERPKEIYKVIRRAVGSTAFVFLLFGISGFYFAGPSTADNILKNFSSKDPILLAARCGLTVTLLSQLPIIVIPFRKTLYPLLWPETNRVEATQLRRVQSFNAVVRRRSSPRDHSHQDARQRTSSLSGHHIDYFSTEEEACRGEKLLMEIEQGFGVSLDAAGVRYGLTLLIATVTLMVAQCVPGVSIVWAIVGSTLTVVICYLLPSAAYISVWRSLGRNKTVDVYVICCHVLFVIGIVFMVVCTPQAVLNAFSI